MSLRYAFALTALVVAAGCADGSGGSASALLGPSAVVGNPPPPAFSGSIVGRFGIDQGDNKVARVLPGISLEREEGLGGSTTGEPPRGIFTFIVRGVEYNADVEQETFWMNFPHQPLPKVLQGRFPNFKRGRIVVQNGQSVGSGVIISIDDENGGFWLISMAQFTQPYEVFVPGCQNTNWVNCITLDAPVVAKFFRVIGFDDRGNPIFEGFESAPSMLTFAELF